MRGQLSRSLAVLAVGLLAVSVAGADRGQARKPRLGGTVVVAWSLGEPPCLNWVLSTCRTGTLWDVLINKSLEGAVEPGPHGWRDVLVGLLFCENAERALARSVNIS